jgi:uncharacterized protein YrrD
MEAVMLHNVKMLERFSLHAVDGDIGKVKDVYFDDEQWVVRYLVVDVGGWLTGRRVILSPMSFNRIDWKGKTLHASLTRAEIERSPPVDTHQPVSRQQESALLRHYNYPEYWVGPFAWGPAAFPGPDERANDPHWQEVQNELEEARKEDRHLRSCNEVSGYSIAALNGNLGHVVDFLFDDQDWSIQYMVVDPRNLWPSKHVLVSPQRIENVAWQDRSVVINLTREEIENGPEYDPDNPPPSPASASRAGSNRATPGARPGV